MLRTSDRIDVQDGIHLTMIDYSDGKSLVKHLNDLEFSRNTCTIPFPYTGENAKEFISRVLTFEEKNKLQRDWAIRNQDGELIGGIGLLYDKGIKSFRSEFGYWLSKAYWNQGIMTSVVHRFTSHIFATTTLVRVDAHVFAHNIASCKVLEKAGFEREGYLKRAFQKGDVFLDAYLYAKLREP
ncbi:MAG: GNAT family N-acetyltransferase [Saprospiraceae bacterium]|nr:GNAT family N-acetyltransferase [Saprospiraceae bacterium]